MGTAARRPMLTGAANAILKASHSIPNSIAPTVGHQWATRFLKRHPQYYIRRQKTLDLNRKNAHNPEVFLEWFTMFKNVIQEKDIQDADCYNMDETGFRIGIGKDQEIITRNSERRAFFASSNNRESVTVVECVSENGRVLPPLVILPGQTHQEIWYTQTGINNNYLLATSEISYSNDLLSYEWIQHFHRFSVCQQVGVWRLLLLDGYASHCTFEFLDFCDKEKIVVFCLPAHVLQPLDVVLFQPYKHWHAQAVDAATRTGCNDFNKVEFLHSLSSIRQKTFTSSSIQSAFCKTGLIPFNPSVVLSQLREANHNMRQSTPPPDNQNALPLLSTPLSIRTLKRHGEVLEKSIMSPTTARNLSSFIKSSLTLATSGALAIEELKTNQSVQTAGAARQVKTRRQVQKGGIVYAKDARQIVRHREVDELAKAQALVLRTEEKKKKDIIKRQQKLFLEIRKVGKAKCRIRCNETSWWNEDYFQYR